MNWSKLHLYAPGPTRDGSNELFCLIVFCLIGDEGVLCWPDDEG
jgi:hypothetical protein